MPITIHCPRCHQPIPVAPQRTGQKMLCPHCREQFWVPATPVNSSPGAEATAEAVESPVIETPGVYSGSGSQGNTAALQAPPIRPAPTAEDPARVPGAQKAVRPEAAVDLAAQPPGSSPAMARVSTRRPAPPKRVAKFISTEEAQSTVSLGADGRLPELRLADSASAEAPEVTARGTNPLVLLGVLCLSAVASLALLVIEFEPPQGSNTPEKARARYMIEQDYFSDLDSPQPRERYQLLLREAQRAFARGDYEEERRLYREVLKLLLAERGPFESLTGSPQRDRKLEEYIITLLRD